MDRSWRYLTDILTGQVLPPAPRPKLCAVATISETQYCASFLFQIVATFQMHIWHLTRLVLANNSRVKWAVGLHRNDWAHRTCLNQQFEPCGWFYLPPLNLMTLLIRESTHLLFTHVTFVFIGLKKGLVPKTFWFSPCQPLGHKNNIMQHRARDRSLRKRWTAQKEKWP